MTLFYYNTTTIPSKNARKRAPKASTLTAPTIIILGKEVVTDSIPIKPIRLLSPTPTNINSYPLEPLLSPYDQLLCPSNNMQSRLANA